MNLAAMELSMAASGTRPQAVAVMKMAQSTLRGTTPGTMPCVSLCELSSGSNKPHTMSRFRAPICKGDSDSCYLRTLMYRNPQSAPQAPLRDRRVVSSYLICEPFLAKLRRHPQLQQAAGEGYAKHTQV